MLPVSSRFLYRDVQLVLEVDCHASLFFFDDEIVCQLFKNGCCRLRVTQPHATLLVLWVTACFKDDVSDSSCQQTPFKQIAIGVGNRDSHSTATASFEEKNRALTINYSG